MGLVIAVVILAVLTAAGVTVYIKVRRLSESLLGTPDVTEGINRIRENVATNDGNGSPFWKASIVIATPSSSGFSQEPAITMESPVIVQITIVSINVPVIDTSP